MVTTINGLIPRLDPGNNDWQWWNRPYHPANIAYIPTSTYGDFTLEADLFKPEARVPQQDKTGQE